MDINFSHGEGVGWGFIARQVLDSWKGFSVKVEFENSIWECYQVERMAQQYGKMD